MADETDVLPDLDPELAALVSAYEAETARDAARVDAALARVTQGVGSAGSAAAAGGLSTTAKVGLVAALVAAVAVVGVVAVGPSSKLAVSRETEEPERPPRVDVPALPSVDAPPAREAARIDVAPAAPVESAAPPPEPRAKPRSSPSGRPPARAPELPSDSLKAELELLRQARSALRGGRAEQALAIVQEHRRQHPTSRVAVERDATEVAALCALGRDDEAREKAVMIERRSARSAEDLLGGCR